jgi:hypothetical protein
MWAISDNKKDCPKKKITHWAKIRPSINPVSHLVPGCELCLFSRKICLQGKKNEEIFLLIFFLNAFC